MFQRANISVQQKSKLCKSGFASLFHFKKGSDCAAGISFSCMFQRANISVQQKSKLCKSGFASLFHFKKGSDCAADISFSCMFQRANVSVQQKRKLCKSGFALAEPDQFSGKNQCTLKIFGLKNFEMDFRVTISEIHPKGFILRKYREYILLLRRKL